MPISNPEVEAENKTIGQRVNALDPFFQELSALENTHVSFTLLKFCVGVCKVNYFPRVTPVQCTKSCAQVFDKLVEKSLRHIVGGVLDTETFRELQLPTDVKPNCQNPTLGLGHTSATTTSAPAFLSSAASCYAYLGILSVVGRPMSFPHIWRQKPRTKLGPCSANKNLCYHFKRFLPNDLRNNKKLRHSFTRRNRKK